MKEKFVIDKSAMMSVATIFFAVLAFIAGYKNENDWYAICRVFAVIAFLFAGFLFKKDTQMVSKNFLFFVALLVFISTVSTFW